MLTNSTSNINNINIFSNKKILGFWIYLMSDCILFSIIFSVYCVMFHNFCISKNFFNLKIVFFETILLLFSSIFYGFLIICAQYKKKKILYFFLLLTFFCGLFFLGIECYEFHHLYCLGYTPQLNGFLSSFFTLVGLHGIHVLCGLLWMLGIFFQILKSNLNNNVYINIFCLGMFWHFLDIIWICLFTIVYLIGNVLL